MNKILCATRGGKESQRTQDAAITLAKEQGAELAFLYVVDVHFLDKTAALKVVDVKNEVTKMGNFMLLMAQERAANQGIDAEMILRKGEFRAELEQVIREEEISLVVFGRPTGEKSVFKLAGLEAMAKDIEANTDIKTMII